MDGPKLACNVVLHCNRHPHYDYRPTDTRNFHQENKSAWIAIHHDPLYRQLVVIQQIKPTSLTYLNCLAKIALPNVARVIAMYHDGESLFSVTEYIELGIADLLPLTEYEIADLFAQILKALHGLAFMSIGFRVSTIRVTSTGEVKLFLDWSYEPTCDQTFLQAGVPYLALFLWRIFDSLGVKACSFRALEFREILKGGHLPDLAHPFLRTRVSLRAPAVFAMKNRLAVSGQMSAIGALGAPL